MPDGYQYSKFCLHYRKWLQTMKIYFRKEHSPGEKLYVDFLRKKPIIVNRYAEVIADIEQFVIFRGFSQCINA